MDRQPPIRLKTIDDRIIDMDELGQSIIAAEGNLALAAERMLGSAEKEAQLLEAISSDSKSLSSFATKARALTIIKMISIMSALHMNLMEGASTLSPKEAGSLYTKMVDSMERLSGTPAAAASGNEDNTLDSLLRRLPPRLAAPLKAALLEQESETITTITADEISE